jgi:hypothetical protein
MKVIIYFWRKNHLMQMEEPSLLFLKAKPGSTADTSKYLLYVLYPVGIEEKNREHTIKKTHISPCQMNYVLFLLHKIAFIKLLMQ